jgi:hypothetical protein
LLTQAVYRMPERNTRYYKYSAIAIFKTQGTALVGTISGTRVYFA